MEISTIAVNPNNNNIIAKDDKDKPYYYDVYRSTAIPVVAPIPVKPVTTSNDFSGLKSMDKWR